MTQKDKELLLKDISARLPYGVKIQVYYEEMAGSGYFDETVWTVDNDEPFHVNDRWIENIKPYLRPMSSMTEKQKHEFESTTIKDGVLTVWTTGTYDWLNENHFDYRGLIPMGLAEDATDKNIY
jgi:hypothetical protein